jgi:hypothetical protein
MFLKPVVVFFTHGMLKNKLKNKKDGKIIIHLVKVMSFRMNMNFHIELMVKYKRRRGL